MRNVTMRKWAPAICVILALLLQACGNLETTLGAPEPESDALYRSQHPEGQDFQTRLLGYEGPVTAVLKGDHAFVGDIAIGERQGQRLIAPDNQVLVDLAGGLSTQGSGIINATGQKWPNGVIPYQFDAYLPQAARDAFLGAVAGFDAKTKIRFVARTSQSNYLNVISGDGCYSYVGRIGGGQDLSLGSGCENVNVARHEMGHALGLAHEQVRQDRDRWITLNVGGSQNAIDYGSAGTPIGAYDFQSMMHYRNYFRDGRWDYVPKTDFPPENVGNDKVNDFTSGDLNAIAAIYGGTGDGGNDDGNGDGDGTVCFYEDVDYAGASFCASGDGARVNPEWNDRVSSVKVPSGYQVQVFRDGDFGGGGYVVPGNYSSFVDLNFNDQMSSFKVVTK